MKKVLFETVLFGAMFCSNLVCRYIKIEYLTLSNGVHVATCMVT